MTASQEFKLLSRVSKGSTITIGRALHIISVANTIKGLKDGN